MSFIISSEEIININKKINIIKEEEIKRIFNLKKYHNIDTQKFKNLNILFIILFGEIKAKFLIEKILNEKKINNSKFLSKENSTGKISNLVNTEKIHAEIFLNQISEIKNHMKLIIKTNK